MEARERLAVPYSGKQLWVKNYIVRILYFLTKGIAAGADAVAYVMEQETGFDRIKINQADNLIGASGKKKIGDLGITMNNLLPDASLFSCVFQEKNVESAPVDTFPAVLGFRIKGRGKKGIVLSEIKGRVMQAWQRVS